MTQLLPKTSIDYRRRREFDAMRGFSMILVVFAHVLFYCDARQCISGQIFSTFRMPLFFFVSGFFAYRATSSWNKNLYIRIFKQKIKAQILCPIIFFALLHYCKNEYMFGWINTGFQEYWFTIALFQMFTIYALATIATHFIHKNITIPLMVILSITAFGVLRMGYTDNIQICEILSTNNFCYFLQFFTLGLIVRSNENKCFQVLSNNYVKATMIILFTVLICYTHRDKVEENELIVKLIGLIISYCALIIVLTLFYSARDYLNGNNRLSQSLCFTGRRTLDIYMLHYFFIPTLPILGTWLLPNTMILFQLLVPGTIAVAITVICLLISNCIRTSSFLAEWLFGVKPKARTQEP